MPASTFIDYQKMNNAYLRLQPTTIQVQDAAKLNEIEQYITWAGGNPTLWDYISGAVVINASTANGRSTVVDYGHDFYHKHALVRLVSTIGATPTATVSIQGSPDSSTWSNISYADYQTDTVFSAANLTITTATTNIKLVSAGQPFRYLSVLVASNTNVTLTVDITMLG